MTVTVTLTGGGTVKYMRFGDAYAKRNDGTLDVFRGGAKQSQSYPSGQWANVEGDEKRWKKSPFWG
ncbi:MAG: hypothetical protein V7643_265 [Mycobacterium sp.]|jgi:hypothetical protein